MKRLSKKLGFSGNYSPQGHWTKYDDRLMESVETDDIKKLKSVLRKKDVSCVKKDSNGKTALHLACMRGKLNCVKIMLKAEKPDLTIMDESGKVPMHLAARGGHTECIKCLIQCLSPVDMQDVASMTPLHHAVSGCHKDAVALLLKYGAPVNIKDKEGRTALILAVQGESEKIVELLCSSGAHIDNQDHLGRTALMYASEYGLQNIVESLILKGADPFIKDLDGNSAESFAKASGSQEIAEILAKRMTNDCQIEKIDGTNEELGNDDTSELDSTVAGDDITLNSSSSFGEMSYQDGISQSSPKSPSGLEFGMGEAIEAHRELFLLKAELKTETLKRTKAEKELRSLRLQLEDRQDIDEETPLDFSDADCNTILSEIEKCVPSPLKGLSLFEEEDSPLVSSLRGQTHALEAQIDRLKKELEETKCNNNNNSNGALETKIPLTAYKALKESQQKFAEEKQSEIDSLKSELQVMNEKEASLIKENELLKDKLGSCKETLEKADKKEKIRELNEKIVSLKIELSRVDQLKNENELLKLQLQNFGSQKVCSCSSEPEIDQEWKKSYDTKIQLYRGALLSIYQGNVDTKLDSVLCQVLKLRGCKITEL
ncbi:ankycorbin-like [Rhopilema esculentum]|uniref:ankycorbin-like n=1 Tax=Rhopilema esculentum TaxID=499914 RepID=UPI0031DDC51F